MEFVFLFINIIGLNPVMVERTPTKTKTSLKKTTTIAAMMIIATIIASPLAINKQIFHSWIYNVETDNFKCSSSNTID